MATVTTAGRAPSLSLNVSYKTWTSRVSSINWKHFCLGVSQPRRIVTVCYSVP